MSRKYNDFTMPQIAAIIVADIVQLNKSIGWFGTKNELNSVKDIMYNFNIVCTDDFTGTWKLKGA